MLLFFFLLSRWCADWALFQGQRVGVGKPASHRRMTTCEVAAQARQSTQSENAFAPHARPRKRARAVVSGARRLGHGCSQNQHHACVSGERPRADAARRTSASAVG